MKVLEVRSQGFSLLMVFTMLAIAAMPHSPAMA